MYECAICHLTIESHQLRHSDGLGHYHMVCEFNIERKRLGMPSYQEVRKIRFISGFIDTHTTGRVENNYNKQVKFY